MPAKLPTPPRKQPGKLPGKGAGATTGKSGRQQPARSAAGKKSTKSGKNAKVRKTGDRANPAFVALGSAAVATRIAYKAMQGAVNAVETAAGAYHGFTPPPVKSVVDVPLNVLDEAGRSAVPHLVAFSADRLEDAVVEVVRSAAVRDAFVDVVREATALAFAEVVPEVLRSVDLHPVRERVDGLVASVLDVRLPEALDHALPGVLVRAASQPASVLSALAHVPRLPTVSWPSRPAAEEAAASGPVDEADALEDSQFTEYVEPADEDLEDDEDDDATGPDEPTDGDATTAGVDADASGPGGAGGRTARTP